MANIFDDPEGYNAERYGTPVAPGTPADWKAAYEERMGRAEAEGVLDDSEAYTGGRQMKAMVILEMDITIVTLSEQTIKVSYRRMAMRTHPDQGGTAAAFREVHAAYSYLMEEIEGL